MATDFLECDKCGDRSVFFGPVGLGEEHTPLCGGFYRHRRMRTRICELCGDPISLARSYEPFDPMESHGYGECVEMPDNFDSQFFDELRHRGVALTRVSA